MSESTASSFSSRDDLASLDLPGGEMRAMGERVLAGVLEHLAGLASRGASGRADGDGDFARTLREPPPEEGAALETLLQPLLEDWAWRSYNCPGPGYLAFIPGGGLYPAALADFVADAMNRYTGVWHAAPALVQLEANVLAWFREWMGFPSRARGLLTTGGSMATLTALVCARERHLGERIREGVLYVSSQAHHCVAKAARLAGILPDRVRTIPVDDRFRMRLDALEDAIHRDRASGLRPFCVASAAGTTNTGAVDPLEAIADCCAREGLWHHVDGAYGAFFRLVDALRPVLAGMERADSLVLDPHKGLFLPYGTGALLVRDGEVLRAAHEVTASYLPPRLESEDFYDPVQYGPELSRDFRGLRVWLPLKLFGTKRFRAALAEKRVLAASAASRIGALDGVRLVAPAELSLFAFHLTWPGASREEEDEATEELLARVLARGRVMLTGCRTEGRFLARVCVLCFRTRERHVDACVEDVAAEARAILASRRSP